MTKTVENLKRPPGRPRSENAKEAILKAALELLDETGCFADVSIEGIALRAEVGKTTVYRWWPNKAALIADAFLANVNPKLRFPDTGSVRDDLRFQMNELVKVFSSRHGRVVRSLLGGGQSDPELIEAFRARWMEPRRKEAREMIRRAVDRGELREDTDPEAALDALYGPLYWRFLVKHLPLDKAFVDTICDYVLSGLSHNKP